MNAITHEEFERARKHARAIVAEHSEKQNYPPLLDEAKRVRALGINGEGLIRTTGGYYVEKCWDDIQKLLH